MVRLIEDVLHIIFGNLNYDDLMRASQVCRSWNHVAELEKQKRRPQLISLSCDDFYEDGGLKLQKAKPFYKFLRAKPAIVFSFVTTQKCSLKLGQHEYKHLAQFNNIKIAEAFCHDVNLNNEEFDTVGLFLPERNSVSYDSVSVRGNTIEACASVANGDIEFKKIMDKFLINKEGQKTIIFGCSYFPFFDRKSSIENFLRRTLDCVNQRYEANSYSLWGIHTYTMDSSEIENSQFEFLNADFYAVTISGPSVKSYSMLLDVDMFLNDGINLIKEILSKTSSNSTMAFFAVPFKPSGSMKLPLIKQRIKVLKDGFPSLQTMIVETLFEVFGTNSHEKDSRAVARDDSVSILILSYK